MSGYDEQTGWVLLTTTSKFTLYINNAPDPPGPVDETGESIYEFALHQCLEPMKDRAAGVTGAAPLLASGGRNQAPCRLEMGIQSKRVQRKELRGGQTKLGKWEEGCYSKICPYCYKV